MIHQGDALGVLRGLPAESVQCCVTSLLVGLLVQLKGSELLEQHVCALRELGGKPLEVGLPGVFPIGAVRPSQGVDLKAQLDLSALPLNVWEGRSEQRKRLLLRQTKAVVRKPSPLSLHVEPLRSRQERVDEINRLHVGHGQLEANGVRRGLPPLLHDSLDADVALGVDHPGQVSQLPLLHLQSVHVHSIPTQERHANHLR